MRFYCEDYDCVFKQYMLYLVENSLTNEERDTKTKYNIHKSFYFLLLSSAGSVKILIKKKRKGPLYSSYFKHLLDIQGGFTYSYELPIISCTLFI